MTGAGSAIVSHPHAAAFANEVARALSDSGALARYYSGVAISGSSVLAGIASLVGGLRGRARNRLLDQVPSGKLSASFVQELAARAWAHLKRRDAYDTMFVTHDARVALSPWPAGTSLVYAYEDGALRTFRKARRLGLRRIWDLPIPHWATLERVWLEESRRWPGAMEHPRIQPAWKKARKDGELDLADAVVVASRFTEESLESLGYARPIFRIPYGFPTERFPPRAQAHDGPFTVLAVGSHDYRKGTPYLLEAWRRLALRDAHLKLVGPMRLSAEFLAPYCSTFEHVPHMARDALAQEYARADLLVFPTLGDGFGMVLQEAMCSAVPVLTTRCGGGPECITDGVDGWIARERDVDALTERLEWAARNRDAVRAMGLAARKRAETWTWQHARREIARVIGALIQ